MIKLIGGKQVEDKHGEVFRQYDLKVYNMYRARGAFLLETNQGLKLLKNYVGSINHLEYENKVKQSLFDRGFQTTDIVLVNKNGDFISENSSGEKYIIKNWFAGEECSLHDKESVARTVQTLAQMHTLMREIELAEEEITNYQQTSTIQLFEKHNRELKRVKAYIRERKQRNEFEVQFLNGYDILSEQAKQATELIKQIEYEKMLNQEVEHRVICHGYFTYHNVIMNKEAVAITNFEKACLGIQIQDLYQFMRKCMEKSNWNESLAHTILESYDKIKPLDYNEMKVLYILLLYPEKFWKVTNYYYNNKKSWISKRNIQKLVDIQEQMTQKENVLNLLFDMG